MLDAVAGFCDRRGPDHIPAGPPSLTPTPPGCCAASGGFPGILAWRSPTGTITIPHRTRTTHPAPPPATPTA